MGIVSNNGICRSTVLMQPGDCGIEMQVITHGVTSLYHVLHCSVVYIVRKVNTSYKNFSRIKIVLIDYGSSS